MKRMSLILVALAALLAAPFAAFAMSHGHTDHSAHDMPMKSEGQAMHGDHAGHDGMSAQGDMIVLGNGVKDGVTAMAHLKDVGEAMAKMGMSTTHHIMVMFTDENGNPLEQGVVAVKVTTPAGETSDPLRLMGMQGHFGADVTLAESGTYQFTVAAKFSDNQARQFHFHFDKP